MQIRIYFLHLFAEEKLIQQQSLYELLIGLLNLNGKYIFFFIKG